MKAKRIFLYALTLVCALIMFSSCGNKNNLSPTTIYYYRVTLADTFVQLGKTDQAKATLESIRDGYTPERPDDDIQDLVQSRLYKLS